MEKKELDVSVIIPIFKGNKYISYWLNKLYLNFSILYEKMQKKSEIVFVNDYPDEDVTIDSIWNEKLSFQIIKLPENGGIHNARVQGLLQSKGNYIVFLDQDDKIDDDYIYSQRSQIKDGDAIVCNGYRENDYMDVRKAIYLNQAEQNCIFDLDYMLGVKNAIVSPGQVMIRKDAIPLLWTQQILRSNGADDYFLWIMMLHEGKKFAINEKLLYSHVKTGRNTSSNIKEMYSSLKEIQSILSNYHILNEYYTNLLMRRIENDKECGRLLGIIQVYDQWVYARNRGIFIGEYLIRNDINKIIIYGMNYIGNRLYDELKNSNVMVLFGIDRNASAEDFPIYKIEEVNKQKLLEADLVIVTVDSSYQEIKHEINVRFDSNIKMESFNNLLIKMCKKKI